MGILEKRENFRETLDKLQLKFEQFSSKVLSKCWQNIWKKFRKNLLKFHENFREWMLQNFKETFERILDKFWMKLIGNLKWILGILGKNFENFKENFGLTIIKF